ncbi:helix-turn-helix domain-containing protein [Streptacidiphilus sp. P02-A3a]|uniref:winged helix-turn-helix domain-containing protein n=1 Tax=Streptacidiphilus sp. P02-A3a TaxID=2704468 RepID=UPI0015FC3532|nr:helix-turn-helix domain-containing protein [Streptacidiphilus sp. P02-A3a]QMU69998.1 hypothetical protein GXP74_18980 [Streptacidiphilus sp. P02-A3a]
MSATTLPPISTWIRPREELREELRVGIGDWSGSRSRSVDLHVHRIRRKLGPRAAALLTTERGVGFHMRAAPVRDGA